MKLLRRTQFGNPVLRIQARHLTDTEIVNPGIQCLIGNMRYTLRKKAYGVGLAAPQVGNSVALSVIGIKPTPTRPNNPHIDMVVINPEIIKTYGEKEPMWEGCVSFGGTKDFPYALVPRYTKIRLRWFDETAKQHEQDFNGLLAHVLQHEVDHLNGILFVDRVEDTSSYMTSAEYRKRFSKKTDMIMDMKQVICSHGFGVDATDRGLFTDISTDFPECAFTMFDYNQIDKAGNMTVRPLENQVRLLNKRLVDVEAVTLLCHSQGCITAAMADLHNVARLIFLAPPDTLDIDRFVKVFGNRPGASFNPESMSSIPRRDGTVTYIGKDYLDSIGSVNVPKLFRRAAQTLPVVIIRAADDEIVGETDFASVPADIVTLLGSHDFSGDARTALKRQLHELLD